MIHNCLGLQQGSQTPGLWISFPPQHLATWFFLVLRTAEIMYFNHSLFLSKPSSKHYTLNIKVFTGTTFSCQKIYDNWTLYPEVLTTVGALSNFRAVAVWGGGLWQELLRGRESIRQGSLQSGQLLKMQQHHYSLTQHTTVFFTASLFISPWISGFFFFCFFRLLIPFSAVICFLNNNILHLSLLHVPFFSFFSPPQLIFQSQKQPAWASFALLYSCWPAEAFFFYPNIAWQWSANVTVLGQE